MRTIITPDGTTVTDPGEVNKLIAQSLRNAQIPPSGNRVDEPMIEGIKSIFTWQDVDEQIKNCNFKKAIGPDGFNGQILLKDKTLRRRVCEELAEYLNLGKFPEYLKEGRLIPLSKK